MQVKERREFPVLSATTKVVLVGGEDTMEMPVGDPKVGMRPSTERADTPPAITVPHPPTIPNPPMGVALLVM